MKIHIFSLALGLVLMGCAHKVARVESELAPPYPDRIIDAHAHFHTEEFGGPQAARTKMKEVFQSANVFGAVVHLDLPEFNALLKTTDVPTDPVVMCAPVVPGQKLSLVDKALSEKRVRCLKIYLGYVPKWASDPFYVPYYRLAEKHQVPVVFHTGDTYDKMAKVKYADPLTVDEIAVTYPNIKFVLAHMGNPWFQSAAEVVYKNDNVYVDTSALMLDDVSKEPKEIVDELITKPVRWFYAYVENPKKFLYGSDWPLVDERSYVQAIQKAIPQEEWDAVFYQNAASLFGFEKAAPSHPMISLKSR